MFLECKSEDHLDKIFVLLSVFTLENLFAPQVEDKLPYSLEQSGKSLNF